MFGGYDESDKKYAGIVVGKHVYGYAQLFAGVMIGMIIEIDYYNNRCLLEWENREREWVTVWDIQNRNSGLST